jgi:hypothetical protein
VLGGREKSLWAIQEHLNPLNTIGRHQVCVKHLLLLEGYLLAARHHPQPPKVWWVVGRFVKVLLHLLKGRSYLVNQDGLSALGEAPNGDQDSHTVVNLNFSKTNICVSCWFTFTLHYLLLTPKFGKESDMWVRFEKSPSGGRKDVFRDFRQKDLRSAICSGSAKEQ